MDELHIEGNEGFFPGVGFAFWAVISGDDTFDPTIMNVLIKTSGTYENTARWIGDGMVYEVKGHFSPNPDLGDTIAGLDERLRRVVGMRMVSVKFTSANGTKIERGAYMSFDEIESGHAVRHLVLVR